MSKKIGVYICSGCGIGECLNMSALEAIANESAPAVVRTSTAFCLEDAALIATDISSAGLDGAVIAACSPRVNTEVFRHNGTFVERVNLREQVAWSHPPQDDETQSLGNDYLRMGIVRTQKATPPAPYLEANERTVLVVGGGIAGVTAALDAARTGYDVVLVEKSPLLGGYSARLHKQVPKRPPYRDPAAVEIVDRDQRADRAEQRAYVDRDGSRGDCRPAWPLSGDRHTTPPGPSGSPPAPLSSRPAGHLAIRRRSSTMGSAVSRTSSRASSSKRWRSAGQIARPSDSQRIRRVALLLADGRGDDAHLPYRRNVSSLVALKQALYIREQHPDATVYILYKDMQSPGQHEYFYKRVQEDPGILFSRGEIRNVTEDTSHSASHRGGRHRCRRVDSAAGRPARRVRRTWCLRHSTRPRPGP